MNQSGIGATSKANILIPWKLGRHRDPEIVSFWA